MQINIAKPLKVFTRAVGLPVMVPGESKYVRVYPKCLQVYDLADELVSEEEIDLTRVHVVQDLMRGGIVVGKRRLFPHVPPSCHISFGSHKKLEWELIRRRGQLSEILPIWHRLGSFYGATLGECTMEMFYNYFEGVMVPRPSDRWHQGFDLRAVEDPISLLRGGAGAIEGMVVKEEGSCLTLLPHLPHQIHCGRMVGKALSFGLCDFEWTKKRPRILKIQTSRECEIALSGQEFKSFRINHKDRLDAGVPLPLQPDQTYWFDRFER